MKVKLKVEPKTIFLTVGKVYNVISVERGWYRIVDNEEEDYLYPPEMFEIVEE